MDKILITGFSGFVARYFIEYLIELGQNIEVLGIDIKSPEFDVDIDDRHVSISFRCINMLDVDALHEVFCDFRPDYILHLAAFSSVAYSWKYPADSFLNNSNIFLNLIEQVKSVCPDCRVLSVGSSEEYGAVQEDDLPLREKHPLNPLSPYAVARVSQEMLSRIFAESFGLNIVMTRSFNHIGPRQDDRFVVPSFIKRILEIKKSGKFDGEIEVGDLSIIRDFVDVRDVVRAYYILLTKGRTGEVYNICSGRPVVLEHLIGTIADKVGVKVHTRVNPEYVRPNDNPAIVGSCYKLETEFGWHPKISLDQTIGDMILYMDVE